jgi:hypothetical protein
MIFTRFKTQTGQLLRLLLIHSFLVHSELSWSQTLTAPPREPCQTSIPAPLRKPKNIIPLGCDRPFTFHGETYSVDSPQSQDASTLRYFVKSVPDADTMLLEYQENRLTSKTSAYIGTLGILMFVFSNAVAKQFDVSAQGPVRDTLRIGGLAFTAGGFFFTFAHLNQNEHLISRSVEAFNKANPNDPIELQFSTGWRF